MELWIEGRFWSAAWIGEPGLRHWDKRILRRFVNAEGCGCRGREDVKRVVAKGEVCSVHGAGGSCYCVQWRIKRFGRGLVFDLFEGKGKGCKGKESQG
jgi:hypothetical protein